MAGQEPVLLRREGLEKAHPPQSQLPVVSPLRLSEPAVDSPTRGRVWSLRCHTLAGPQSSLTERDSIWLDLVVFPDWPRFAEFSVACRNSHAGLVPLLFESH